MTAWLPIGSQNGAYRRCSRAGYSSRSRRTRRWTTSEEKPRPWRKRARLARSSRVAGAVRYLRCRMARAVSSSLAADTRSIRCSATPFALSSWRMCAGPYLRARTCARCSAKRSLESCFFCSSWSSRACSSPALAACGASLRSSSARECSRLASSRSARALSAAALSRGELLNLLVFRLVLDGLGGRRSDAGLLADTRLDLARQRRVLLQEVARVVLALAE